MQLARCDGVEAFGRLLVAFALLGAKRAGPMADGIRGEEFVAPVLLHPELKFGLGLEDADEEGCTGGEAFGGEALGRLRNVRRSGKGQASDGGGALAIHAVGRCVLQFNGQRIRAGRGCGSS